jgi:hypothetical protein
MTRYIIILYKTNQNILLNLFFNQSSIKECIFFKKNQFEKRFKTNDSSQSESTYQKHNPGYETNITSLKKSK